MIKIKVKIPIKLKNIFKNNNKFNKIHFYNLSYQKKIKKLQKIESNLLKQNFSQLISTLNFAFFNFFFDQFKKIQKFN